jgi:hypothetical protein
LTIWNPDYLSVSANLDRFGIKNILFMTLFFIKRTRLATDKKVRFTNGPVFKCPVPGKMDHLNTRLSHFQMVTIWILFCNSLFRSTYYLLWTSKYWTRLVLEWLKVSPKLKWLVFKPLPEFRSGNQRAQTCSDKSSRLWMLTSFENWSPFCPVFQWFH